MRSDWPRNIKILLTCIGEITTVLFREHADSGNLEVEMERQNFEQNLGVIMS